MSIVIFFFFQAEDGIRDVAVTGVQTCALPILVMAILGAAVVPPIMGKISDLSNIQRAFLVPLLCYAYVWYFAVAGYKPKPAGGGSRTRGQTPMTIAEVP